MKKNNPPKRRNTPTAQSCSSSNSDLPRSYTGYKSEIYRVVSPNIESQQKMQQGERGAEKSIIAQFRAMQIECSKEKKRRENMERELVLQNHKYANLLKAKQEECKFWQNKVTQDQWQCLELNLKLKTMEYEDNEKQNNMKREEDPKLERLLQDHEELQEKYYKLEEEFTLLDDKLRNETEKNASVDEKLENLEKEVSYVSEQNLFLTESFNKLNSDTCDARFLLFKIYNLNSQALLWILWNITTHFTQLNGVPQIPFYPTPAQMQGKGMAFPPSTSPILVPTQQVNFERQGSQEEALADEAAAQNESL